VEREIPVRELNQHTSAVLREVQEGHSVTILKAGKPVARLVPVSSGSSGLDQLIAEGRVTPATIRGPFPPPRVFGDPTRDVAAELAAFREEERC
jgi:prevent-host-death family protein